VRGGRVLHRIRWLEVAEEFIEAGPVAGMVRSPSGSCKLAGAIPWIAMPRGDRRRHVRHSDRGHSLPTRRQAGADGELGRLMKVARPAGLQLGLGRSRRKKHALGRPACTGSAFMRT